MRTFVADSDDEGSDLVSDIGSAVASPESVAAPAVVAESNVADASPTVSRKRLLTSSVRDTPSPLKRRKTMVDSITPSPLRKAVRSKTLKTYGKTSQRHITRQKEYEDGQDGQDGQNTPTLPAGPYSQPPRPQEIEPTEGDTAPPRLWELPATLREDFAQHDPLAMFPDLSSTIPDNTMTQQRLVQDAIEAIRVQAPTEITITDPTTQRTSTNSIPWSEFIHTPSQDVRSGHEPSQELSGRPPIDHTAHTVELAPQLLSVTDSEIQQDASNNANDREHGMANGIQEAMDSKQSTVCAETGSLGKATQASKQKKHRKSNSVQGKNVDDMQNTTDPLKSDEIDIGLPKERYKPRPSRSCSAKVPDSEPVDLSMTSEKASRKPRRSKTTVDHNAKTVQPSSSEKMEMICAMGFSPTQARKALKETSGNIEKAIDGLCKPTESTPGPLEDVSFVGQQDISSRSPVTEQPSEPAAKQSLLPEVDSVTTPNTDSSIRVDATPAKQETWENQLSIEKKDSSPAVVIFKAVPGSAKHAKKIKAIMDSDDELQDEPLAVEGHASFRKESPHKNGDNAAESAIHEKSSGENKDKNLVRPPRKVSKVKRSQTMPHFSSQNPDDLEDDEPAKPKRRRGRPRKEVNQKPDTAVHEDSMVEEADGRRFGSDEVTKASLPDIKEAAEEHPNEGVNDSTPSNIKGDNEAQTVELNDVPKSQSSEACRDTKLPTPSTPPDQTTKTTTKMNELSSPIQIKTAGPHSPLTKGKVPYRVGLSRRMRIAPLLRVVKK